MNIDRTKVAQAILRRERREKLYRKLVNRYIKAGKNLVDARRQANHVLSGK